MYPYLQIFESLAKNSLFIYFTFLTSTILAVISIILTITSRKVKSSSYSKKSKNIIENHYIVDKSGFLDKKFERRKFKNLTATKLAFWNSGFETIDGQDISSYSPLNIHAKNGHIILDVKILYVKKIANQFEYITSEDKYDINLKLDYMDKSEGIILQILHTGTSSEDIEMQGTIKGGGDVKLIEIIDFSQNYSQNYSQNLMFFSSIILYMIMTLSYINILLYNTELSEIYRFIIFLLIILLIIVFTGNIYVKINKIPKGLKDEFLKDIRNINSE